MPKITAHGGPTNKDAEPGQVGYIDQYLEKDEKGVQSSAGKSSSRSGSKPQTMPGTSGKLFQKLAPTTDTPSGPDQSPESSSAPSTDGSTPETTSGRAEPPAKSATRKQWLEFLVDGENYNADDFDGWTKAEMIEFWESEGER